MITAKPNKKALKVNKKALQSVASAIAGLIYGILFPEYVRNIKSIGQLKREINEWCNHRFPTRQSCETVNKVHCTHIFSTKIFICNFEHYLMILPSSKLNVCMHEQVQTLVLVCSFSVSCYLTWERLLPSRTLGSSQRHWTLQIFYCSQYKLQC